MVIPLVLVLGGVAGAGYFFKIGPAAGVINQLLSTRKVVAEAPPPVPAAPTTRTIDIGTYIIPIVQDHAIRRQIGMDMLIEVSPKDAEKIGTQLPRLQNAFLVGLYDFIPLHADPKSAADKRAIRDRLVFIANQMFGAGAVHNIVMKAMYVR